MTGEPTPKRRPVIVVHGYLAAKEMMIPMRSKLERAGFEAHIAQLPPLLLGKIEPMAGLLASEVDRILGGYDVERCDLLGVSLGGLLGLRYLQRFGGPARVRRFVAVGTPFKGSGAARAATLLLGRISPAAYQLTPGSDFIETLVREGLPEGVEALSICATRDALAPPAACKLEGAGLIELLGPPAPLAHQALVVSSEVLDYVARFLGDDGGDVVDQASRAG
jgi:pimeloyl-ACP methyl ester carboxylesterase